MVNRSSSAGVIDIVRDLSTRGSLAAAAAQVQSIKKRVQRRKLVVPEDTGQRHGVSDNHKHFFFFFVKQNNTIHMAIVCS